MGLDNAKPKVLFPHMKKPHCQLPEFLTTPLIEAATFGHIDIVKFLLDNGADPDIKAGFSSDTAHKMAKQNGHKAIMALLSSRS